MKKSIPLLAAPLLLLVGQGRADAQIVQFQESSSFSRTTVTQPLAPVPVVQDFAPLIQYAPVPVPVPVPSCGYGYGAGPVYGVGRFRSFGFTPACGLSFAPFLGFHRSFVGFTPFGFRQREVFRQRIVAPRRQVVRQRTVIRN